MNTNLINGQYTLDKKIGRGSFGEVYIGYDRKQARSVAIKLESESRNSILKHEHDVYREINEIGKPVKIPDIYWYGALPDGRKALVMQCLGSSLEHLLNKRCKGMFSIKTTLMIGVQCIKLLHSLHESCFIHRDIKPDNFITGLKGDRELYMIDLGLAKRFKSPERVHLKQTTGKSIVGTARYSSINSHIGIELSRRDDLESLGYMLIFFVKGQLPWQGLVADNKSVKYELIGRMKQETTLSDLCSGLPKAFIDYMTHVRSLEFKEKPNYKLLHETFMECFKQMEFTWDCYDWETRM